MIRKLVLITLLLLTIPFLFGCSNIREDGENIGSNGIIFVAVPAKSNDYYKPFYGDILSFHEQFKEKKATGDKVISLPYNETGYDDIWIRDVAPVATSKLVKFVYAPQNLPKDISEYLNDSFSDWLFDNKFEVLYSSLVLDGGNFIWNKTDTVIITTRILEDNPELTKAEIIASLKSDLSISNVILIPPEVGDVLAHADGMVKFIDESTLFISDFLGDEDFRLQVENIILGEMPTAKFIVMSSAYTEDGQYDDEIASAKGLYINMLETNNALYVPQFHLPEDKEMLEFIHAYTDKPIIPLGIESLSTMGGAVNCLTWYCPSEFIPADF